MSKILVLNSSVSGGASVSRPLVQNVVDRLLEVDPNAIVATRDLDAQPIPHLIGETFGGVRREDAVTEAERAARTLSDALIAEIEGADTIVIGAPMYNFGIPSTLKAWFDHVLRPGRAFRYSETGPEGLFKGKRAIIVVARGGLYSSGAAKALDSQEPHLRTMLGFMGITDVSFVRAEKLGYGPEQRNEAIANAQVEIARFGETPLQQAA
jgi:FMN-dependent NADH-azoreductase